MIYPLPPPEPLEVPVATERQIVAELERIGRRIGAAMFAQPQEIAWALIERSEWET